MQCILYFHAFRSFTPIYLLDAEKEPKTACVAAILPVFMFRHSLHLYSLTLRRRSSLIINLLVYYFIQGAISLPTNLVHASSFSFSVFVPILTLNEASSITRSCLRSRSNGFILVHSSL
ncbi:hypothetical protein BOTBODRAFT_439740 [Botryobasidium botryosum FD-172 SS1]|uniref:Uncharacterized protein n=1 Tax=Botryobasidium botryosum (strain FD-172 SS1) TaxID=930990 RepID=A0A067MV35_BOTB1|nr:hypothetical protein BOTBODRAFT_439740 [Botryobasidium botryosum FD-172 SS1]